MSPGHQRTGCSERVRWLYHEKKFFKLTFSDINRNVIIYIWYTIWNRHCIGKNCTKLNIVAGLTEMWCSSSNSFSCKGGDMQSNCLRAVFMRNVKPRCINRSTHHLVQTKIFQGHTSTKLKWYDCVIQMYITRSTPSLPNKQNTGTVSRFGLESSSRREGLVRRSTCCFLRRRYSS